jgi:hypothetical protein
MRARFGLRWLTEFGDKPTPPWIQLLNGFTPDMVRGALELMAEQKREHPPTLPAFEALLKRAAVKHNGEHERDWTRGYWRAVMVSLCEREAFAVGNIASLADFEGYLSANRLDLGASLRSLLDELVDLERNNGGQRTLGLEDHARKRCSAILRAFVATHSAAA